MCKLDVEVIPDPFPKKCFYAFDKFLEKKKVFFFSSGVW